MKTTPKQLQFARTLLMSLRDAEDKISSDYAPLDRAPLSRRIAKLGEQWDALPDDLKTAATEANNAVK